MPASPARWILGILAVDCFLFLSLIWLMVEILSMQMPCRIQRKWDGPKQYTDASTKELMMLPTDMALIWDKKFKPYVEQYAKDQDKFFEVWGLHPSMLRL